jgi:predicted nucleotidyltransferase
VRIWFQYHCSTAKELKRMTAQRPVEDKKTIFATLGTVRNDLLTLGVISIGLFGSFARGEQNDESDVDLLVEFAEEKRTFDNFMDLAFLLDSLFGRKVEIITPEAMSPYILPTVLKEVELFHVAA